MAAKSACKTGNANVIFASACSITGATAASTAW
jgi:hypothetical protein